jgi:hypothetical protein
MVQKKILRYERTPYAKQIRKDYERGIVKERRCNMRQYSVRTDDCTNTSFDCAVKGGDYGMGNAFETCPLAVMTHLADMEATYLVECLAAK